MKSLILILLTGVIFGGCSAKWQKAGLAALVGGGTGALVGYTVVHHGKDRKYQYVNTGISAAIGAAILGGAYYYHSRSLEDQRIEIAREFSRSTYLEVDGRTEPRSGSRGIPLSLDDTSVRLDDKTRWVLPEFFQRRTPVQPSETELIVGHDIWEIVRPGFFVTPETNPEFFQPKEK
jgi:hypothetical protein